MADTDILPRLQTIPAPPCTAGFGKAPTSATRHEAVLSAVVIPDRPAPGAPCNGCGFCCLAECCPPAILIHRRRRGPCPELTLDAAGTAYRCGLLVRAPGMLRPLVARWIAAGQGCDSDA